MGASGWRSISHCICRSSMHMHFQTHMCILCAGRGLSPRSCLCQLSPWPGHWPPPHPVSPFGRWSTSTHWSTKLWISSQAKSKDGRKHGQAREPRRAVLGLLCMAQATSALSLLCLTYGRAPPLWGLLTMRKQKTCEDRREGSGAGGVWAWELVQS